MRTPRRPHWSLAAAFLLLLAASSGAATLSGRVTDTSGSALPGVTISVASAGANVAASSTAPDGSYEIPLAPGRYRVIFQLINFATRSSEIAIGSVPVTLDVTMVLTASAEVVVVAPRTFRNLADIDVTGRDLIGIAETASTGVVTAAEIETRPIQRPGDVLETVPGVIISQHSGEGKANQYYLRGFNIDHGTDFAVSVAGVPVNLPTHGHGQGYADANFLIPELVGGVRFRKGPYFADAGDFSTAGATEISYLNQLESPIVSLTGGRYDYGRLLVAASPELSGGTLLAALELSVNDGPWVNPDDFEKRNAVLRWSKGTASQGLSLTAMFYDATWNSTDQIPRRAVDAGDLDRFGAIDPTDGGETSRYAISLDWQRADANRVTTARAWAFDYEMDLFSNFTYFLDDAENGDQFEQVDDRVVAGGSLTHRWLSSIAGRDAESAVGLQLRHDRIDQVGLFNTVGRQRRATVRDDRVDQSSIALWGQSSVQLSPRSRAVFGLRADHYRFDVESNLPANSGTDDTTLVSPKMNLVFGPFRDAELYVSSGMGFHSNDGRGTTITVDPKTGEPVERVDPLVRTAGAEIGVRAKPVETLYVTAALWGLDIDSELLFIGDAGTTEASRPSRRWGIEVEGYANVTDRLALDAEVAWSHARFRDEDPAGDFIPGAIELAASAGVLWNDPRGWSLGIRYRHFGPRPLVEDDSARSDASNLFNGHFGWNITSAWSLELDFFNIFDADASDIDYFYASRLPGEPDEGLEDIHFHPVEPRSFRASLVWRP